MEPATCDGVARYRRRADVMEHRGFAGPKLYSDDVVVYPAAYFEDDAVGGATS